MLYIGFKAEDMVPLGKMVKKEPITLKYVQQLMQDGQVVSRAFGKDSEEIEVVNKMHSLGLKMVPYSLRYLKKEDIYIHVGIDRSGPLPVINYSSISIEQ